jgi:hypothetical protein
MSYDRDFGCTIGSNAFFNGGENVGGRAVRQVQVTIMLA